jgi:hypothetical protein
VPFRPETVNTTFLGSVVLRTSRCRSWVLASRSRGEFPVADLPLQRPRVRRDDLVCATGPTFMSHASSLPYRSRCGHGCCKPRLAARDSGTGARCGRWPCKPTPWRSSNPCVAISCIAPMYHAAVGKCDNVTLRVSSSWRRAGSSTRHRGLARSAFATNSNLQ